MVLHDDWLYERNGYVCGVRVAGVLIKNNQILVQRDRNGNEYALPGGHIKIGETLEDGLRREVQEEIDMAITVKRLLWSEESFWNQNGTMVHHLCFYYLAEAPLYFDIPRSGEFISHRDNDDVVIGWLNTEKIEKITIYPSFLKTELRTLCSPIKHFVTYD